jgi:hypothetical protein
LSQILGLKRLKVKSSNDDEILRLQLTGDNRVALCLVKNPQTSLMWVSGPSQDDKGVDFSQIRGLKRLKVKSPNDDEILQLRLPRRETIESALFLVKTP